MTAPDSTVKPFKRTSVPAKPLNTYGALPATGFVRLADLRPILPISDSTIWRRVRDGTFPTPIKLSDRVTVWRAEDVREWLDSQNRAA